MPIGLGLAALGRPGYLSLGHGADLGADRSVDAPRRHAHAVLDAAYEGGVRAFDAARSYGRAEEFLGQWLRSRRPEDVTVSSKWGYVYTAGWRVDADPPEVKRHDADTLRRQLAETRERLGSGSRSTRSTRRRLTAVCWKTTRCSPSWGCCATAVCRWA